MYGKLKDGILINAPKRLTMEDGEHYHPTAEMYAQFGYLPIVDTPYPDVDEESTVMYESRYEEIDGKIVQVWTAVELCEGV